ncbi:hypothetical protein J2X71_001304 [Rhizobium sp. 1399]|nr:hypothetical protein [Rhizobium sp. 1399]
MKALMENRKRSWPRPILLGCAMLAATCMLAACASQIMKSYVGVPIGSVMLDYGPPDNVYELRPGERAIAALCTI